jgi:thioredoxin
MVSSGMSWRVSRQGPSTPTQGSAKSLGRVNPGRLYNLPATRGAPGREGAANLFRGARLAASVDEELERIRAKLRGEILEGARSVPVAAVSQADFDGFVRRRPLVLVDVWAPWCGPCRVMSPLVEELARQWGGRVAVAKVNADEAPKIVERYRILGIPTFLWFKDGALVGRQVGVQPRAAFEEALAELQA